MLPRWLEENFSADANWSPSASAATTTPSTSILSIPTSSQLPVSWLISTSTPTTGKLLSKFADLFCEEKALVAQYANIVRNQATYYPYGKTSEYIWIADIDTAAEISTVEIQLSSGAYYTIEKANTPHDLLYSFTYKYYIKDGIIAIAGLNLIEQILAFGDESSLHVEYPNYLNHQEDLSILVHTLSNSKLFPEIAENRFTGLYSSQYTKLISFSSVAGSALDTINIRINLTDSKTAYRTNVWNFVDDLALLRGFYRHDGETNSSLASRIDYYNRTSRSQGWSNVVVSLAQIFGLATNNFITSSATAFTLASGSVSWCANGLQEYNYANEALTVSGNVFLSRMADPDYVSITDKTRPVVFTRTGNSYSFAEVVQAPKVNALLQYYTQSGSVVTFSDNLPYNENMSVLVSHTNKVIATTMSEQDQRSKLLTKNYLIWRDLGSAPVLQEGATFV